MNENKNMSFPQKKVRYYIRRSAMELSGQTVQRKRRTALSYDECEGDMSPAGQISQPKTACSSCGLHILCSKRLCK